MHKVIEKLPSLKEVKEWANHATEIKVEIGIDPTEEAAFARMHAGPRPDRPLLVATRADLLRAAANGVLFFSWMAPPESEDEVDEVGDSIYENLMDSGFMVTYSGDPSVKIGIAVDRLAFLTEMTLSKLEDLASTAKENAHDPDTCETCQAERYAKVPDEAEKLEFSTTRYEAFLWFDGKEWVYDIRDTEANNFSLERGRSGVKADVLAEAHDSVRYYATGMD